MIRIRPAIVFIVFLVLPSVLPPLFAEANALEYPQTRRGDQIDNYHGTDVADPYRWLEDDIRGSEETAAWVAAQNEVTAAYFESLPERQRIFDRLEELWNFERYSTPRKASGRYFYTKNDGLQDQSVLYTRETLDGPPRVLLDPNTWSDDGTVSLGGWQVSHDGRYLAYGIRDAGSDWRTWRVLEVESGRLLDDELRHLKFGGITWSADDRGFFYSRYAAPQEGQEYQSLNLDQKLYYHRLGTSQATDVLVHQRPDQPRWGFRSSVSEDGRYLVITVSKGTGRKLRVLYKDLHEPYGMVVPLIEHFDNEYSFVANDGPIFFFETDLEAPKKRLVAIDIRRPERAHWREILPQTDDTLQRVGLVGNLFLARYLEDAKTRVRLHRLSGELVREVEFPTLGSAFGFSGGRGDTETFYTFSSFNRPPTIYRYDLISGESKLFQRAEPRFDPEDYEVRQIFYPSKDGTKIPMFIAHKKGIRLDGTNPTLLFGYGGFGISLTPSFAVDRLAWMEMGGVFAMPNLRGGGEYGEEWHQAGTRLNKQNVFDDFIAAGEWLIQKGYTRSDKLAVRGGSNGGLLVGAVLTQRPDLFGAALPAVGVMDMLRFHQFTAGRFWVDDYGSADDPEEFKALLDYSPYHRIEPGTKYPPTLVTTADTDDRVVPGHSFKFAAALQHAQAGASPVLIRIESRAGHGGGTPTSKIVQQTADLWSFLVEALDMELEGVPQVEQKKRPHG